MATRYAAVSLASDLTWTDGVLFDGSLVFQVVMPAVAQLTGPGGQVVSGSPTLAATYPPTFVPLWHVIPVVQGKIGTAARIWKNSSYNPRGTKYSLFVFDAHNTLLSVSGAPGGLFSVEDDLVLTLSPVSVVYTDGTAALTQVGVTSFNVYTAGGSGSASVTQRNLTLTANTTVSQVVESSGNVLSMVITEDGTGFWTLGFNGAQFSNVGLVPFNNSPGAVTTLLFVSNGTTWVFMAGSALGA